MFPHPMLRSEPPDDPAPLPAPDLTRLLDEHVARGFPPDLALDLVLNELVLRAADATHASAAALALMRGDEMVCRASTGLHAPDLGIPINLRDGLSGACVRTREPQLSNDTEVDPRVDAAIARRLGIRSMLLVPVFDEEVAEGAPPNLAGVLEVFSPLAHAFNERSQKQLEEFARECARVRHAATQLPDRPIADIIPLDVEPTKTEAPGDISPAAVPRLHQAYEGWTLVLAALVIVAAIAVSFLIGSRIGWLRAAKPGPPSPPASMDTAMPLAAPNASAAPHKTSSPLSKAPNNAAAKSGGAAASSSSSDELVVYEKGKVIFRMKPVPAPPSAAPAETIPAHDAASTPDVPPDRAATQAAASSVIPASSNTRIPSPRAVWLAPAQAERRLVSRVEPQYPPDALATRLSGNVVLEVHVAEDGTVSSVRTLSGDPVLAAAAAEAVRNWRYQPYLSHEQPSPFQTDVTLTFSLPN